MELSKEQLKTIASNILVSDIIDYINNHRSEYEEFLREEELKENIEREEVKSNENRRFETVKAMG